MVYRSVGRRAASNAEVAYVQRHAERMGGTGIQRHEEEVEVEGKHRGLSRAPGFHLFSLHAAFKRLTNLDNGSVNDCQAREIMKGYRLRDLWYCHQFRDGTILRRSFRMRPAATRMSMKLSYVMRPTQDITDANVPLRQRLAALEDGRLFADAGIANMLNGDSFSWYIDDLGHRKHI